MFGNEQKRHYPKILPYPRYCTNRDCPNHAKSVKFGWTCNECGSALVER